MTEGTGLQNANMHSLCFVLACCSFVDFTLSLPLENHIGIYHHSHSKCHVNINYS